MVKSKLKGVVFAVVLCIICFSSKFALAEENFLIKIHFSNQPEDAVMKINPVPNGDGINLYESDLILKRIKTFQAENAPLKTVLYGILSDTKLNVLFDPEVNSSLPITVKFDDVDLLSALNSIMQMSNLKFVLEGNILKIKAFEKKIFKIPYVKTISSYTSSIGGNITGGAAGAGGGTAGGTASGGGISGNFSVEFEGTKDQYDIYTQIENNLRSILSEKGKYTLNRLTGALVVEDRPDRVKLVEIFLANLKRELDKQVLIEARILEVSLSDGYQYGIDWNAVARNFLNSAVTFSQNLSLGSSVASLSVVRTNFNALINAVGNFGKVNTLSNPRILVTNNQTAVLTSGNIYPFWDKQVNITGGTATTQPFTTVTYARRNVLSGVLLGVTPNIEDNGEVLLNIVPISTSIQGIRQYKEGNVVVAESPILNIKESGTVVRAKDGDIIIIGGLIDKTEKNEETKAPLLGDIPLLGYLFKQKAVSTEKKELIIFLKVTKVNLDKPY
ncbi:MAG: hypothetical protein N2Z80_02150 [Hydrogenothermaceae bacterium]|nr:hypothetical protein [Hydrogenothermaceae bacterium]